MFDASQRPTIKPGTRTYIGANCEYGHGGQRYASNGMCVVCQRVKGYDRYQDQKRRRASPKFQAAKQEAYRLYMENGLKALREAAVQLREAKAYAPRGAWVKNLQLYGLQPKAIAAIRRWLEEREQLERQAAREQAAPREPGKSWME